MTAKKHSAEPTTDVTTSTSAHQTRFQSSSSNFVFLCLVCPELLSVSLPYDKTTAFS